MVRAIIDFRRIGDGKILMKGMVIYKAMNGNQLFPESADLVVQLGESVDAFKKALPASVYGSRHQKAVKKNRRAELFEIMHSLCECVNYQARGDKMMLLTTGFSLSKEGRKPVKLFPLKSLKLESGMKPGSVLIKTRVGEGTSHLYIQHVVADTIDNNTPWITTGAPRLFKNELHNVPLASTVWIRIMSIGRRKQHFTSTPVSRIVI